MASLPRVDACEGYSLLRCSDSERAMGRIGLHGTVL